MGEKFCGKEEKRALVLGVGGAKGLAHVGVLMALEEAGIQPDLIVGASMGALIGFLYSAGLPLSAIQQECLKFHRQKYFALADPSFSFTGFISGKRLLAYLKKITGNPDFEGLKIPLAVVVTDSTTGEKLVIQEGSVAEAVRGSISIPGIFTPHPWQGRWLLDGGLTEPLPVPTALSLGATEIYAVDVLGRLPPRMSRRPTLLDFYIKSVAILQRSLTRTALEDADVVIQPDMSEVLWSDFHKARFAIQEGYQTAKIVLTEKSLRG